MLKTNLNQQEIEMLDQMLAQNGPVSYSQIIAPCPVQTMNPEKFQCLTKRKKEYKTNYIFDCLESCPLQCNTVTFSKEISTASFPSRL
jgi:hypothetical protein